jgi:hypothetical protein
VVDKEQPRAGRRGPFKGLKTPVHGKGDLAYPGAVIINLNAVEGTIRVAKTVQIQKAPEKPVQLS